MSEPIIEIKPVRRGEAKLVIGLAAPSGEGKTYSALQLALGLAGGDPRKVGLLDTEEGRGSLYDDIFDKPFLHGVLSAPFSPKRYSEAMRQFAAEGVECLVIDSMSHEHEGEGGLEEIANLPLTQGRKTANWIGAKREHRKFMNTLLYLPCHVVACFRAREKMDFKNTGPRGEPVSLGIQPITEKNVLFEMSASFILEDQGRKRKPIKLPECLKPILGGDGYITPEHGRKLLEWVGGKNPVERMKRTLQLAASKGTDALKEAWAAIPPAERNQFTSFKETLKAAAAHADEERKAVNENRDNGAPEES